MAILAHTHNRGIIGTYIIEIFPICWIEDGLSGSLAKWTRMTVLVGRGSCPVVNKGEFPNLLGWEADTSTFRKKRIFETEWGAWGKSDYQTRLISTSVGGGFDLVRNSEKANLEICCDENGTCLDSIKSEFQFVVCVCVCARTK